LLRATDPRHSLNALHRQHLQRLDELWILQRAAQSLLLLELVVFLGGVERALEAADVPALALIATVHGGQAAQST
jgi:hypothetical protein